MQIERIQNKIYEIRSQKIMLDFDLAELYEVETKVLNQAVKRNPERFPLRFMFRITVAEWENMRSQIVTASDDVYDAINFLLQKDNLETSQKQRTRIGYKTNSESTST